MKQNKKSKRKSKLTITECLALIGGILAIFQIFEIVNNAVTENHENRQVPYYTNEYDSDWLYLNEAEVILSNKSELTVYNQKDTIQDYYSDIFSLTGNAGLVQHNGSGFDNIFYGGVVMVALYHNLDDNERTITKFTVKADNIVENMSPQLVYHLAYANQGAACEIENIGWGETGLINVHFLEISPWMLSDNLKSDSVHVALKADSPTSWECESILPGNSISTTFLSDISFDIDWKDVVQEEYTYARFYLRFLVEAKNSNYSDIIDFGLEVSPHACHIFDGLGGSDEMTGYGVEIDTSSENWSKTFRVNQILPSKKTIRIPIIIYPKKSCSMSIQIEFETLDGEVIKSQPLKNASFVIPYYDDVNYLRQSFDTYVDGLEWDENGRWIYFPYSTTSTVVNPQYMDVSRSRDLHYLDE